MNKRFTHFKTGTFERRERGWGKPAYLIFMGKKIKITVKFQIKIKFRREIRRTSFPLPILK